MRIFLGTTGGSIVARASMSTEDKQKMMQEFMNSMSEEEKTEYD